MKKKRVGKILKSIVALVVLVAVIGVGYLYMQSKEREKATSGAPTYSFVTAEKGDVRVGVTASGSVSTQHNTDVAITWSGKVKELPYAVGDTINEGDVFAVVENDDLASSVASANDGLRQQQLTLEKQQENLYQTITAPEVGRVKMLKASVGEDASTTASAHGQICWISPDGMMTLTATTKYEMGTGQILEVADRLGVRYKATVTANNGLSCTMDIEDDIRLDPGDNVLIFYRGDNDTILGEGTVSIKNGVRVTGTGKIKNVYVKEGETVGRGQVLFDLENREAEYAISSQNISITEAQRKVSDLRKDLGKSELLSPASGVITSLNIKAGTAVGSDQIIATIQDYKNLETIVNVDEMDIAKVQVGQKANVTLEALEDEVYTGTVSKIAIVGSVSNNFATYAVTVLLDKPGAIKIGMSCEADIEVNAAKDALILPVEALQRDAQGYYVLVPKPLTPEEQESRTQTSALTMGITSPEMEEKRVEVGLLNEDYAQILSGLTQGESVGYASETTNPFFAMMMGGGGGGEMAVAAPNEGGTTRIEGPGR